MKASAFEFEAGEFTGCGDGDFAGEAEAFAECVCDGLFEFVGDVGGRWFDSDHEFVHGTYGFDVDAKFDDVVDFPKYGFDAGREDVIASNSHHIVGSPEDSAGKPEESSANGVFIGAGLNKVSGAVSN